MLSLLPTNDKDLLNNLSRELFRHEYPNDVGYLLLYNGEPIGLARFSVGETSRLHQIDIKDEYKDNGYKDFFTRAILYRLSQVSLYIVIDYYSEYFEQFGFSKTKEGKMTIETSELHFPSNCKHKE